MNVLLKSLLLLGLVSPTLGAASNLDVSEFQLENGMKILVKEDHRAPVMISQVWYKVGSSYEFSGITGVSHVLEHMMFKGTPTIPAGEFSRLIAEKGGSQNAFTSLDYTGYYQYMASEHLETALQLEADRMRNLVFDADEFAKEVEVVKEERMMRTEDNPTALTFERFNAAAHLNGPYQNPPIGWVEDLNELTIGNLQDWYDAWYRPNNATLVVVGDVDAQQVLALATQYFGPLKAAALPEVKSRIEAQQRGERHIIVRAPAKIPYVIIGYPVPTLKTAEIEWEPYALDMLAAILDGGGSARFARELIRGAEVAASANAGYSGSYRYQTHFLIDGAPAKDQTIEALQKALYAQIERVRTEPVTQGELARIKAQVISSKIYARDSIQNTATSLGALETVGLGWQLSDQYAERIKAVTADQVLQVAKKYLVDTQKTVAQLIPEEIEAAVVKTNIEQVEP